MNCQEIPLIKNYIVSTFDTSSTLKQAISSSRDDFKEDIVPSVYALLNDKLFLYKYPRTLENIQKTIVSICVNLSARPTLRDGSIYIYVYTHVDLMNTVYNMTRNDYIMCRIEEIMDNTNAVGVLGEISFVDTRELSPVKDWVVNVVEYKFTNLNFPIVKTVDSYE